MTPDGFLLEAVLSEAGLQEARLPTKKGPQDAVQLCPLGKESAEVASHFLGAMLAGRDQAAAYQGAIVDCFEYGAVSAE